MASIASPCRVLLSEIDSSVSVPIIAIGLARFPSEVAKTVVGSVAVVMGALHACRAFASEGDQHKSMNVITSMGAKADAKISIFPPQAGLENFPPQCDRNNAMLTRAKHCAINAPDPTERARLIARMARYRLPFFIHAPFHFLTPPHEKADLLGRSVSQNFLFHE